MFLIIVLLSSLLAATNAQEKVVGYYASWSAYGKVQPEDLDPKLCTHINYAFMGIQNDGNLKVLDDNLEINQGLYRRVTDLKKKNPNLKVLISVGGASSGSAELFSRMASDPGRRGPFVGSARYFIQTYGFDGLDIDWEVPEAKDRANYITLLQELRNEFNHHGWLLTAAVASSPSDGYNVPQMARLLDWINIMSYDFYGPWSHYTGQNSALYAASIESDWEKANLNVAASARNWVNAGVNPKKLVVGVAFYGRSFTLADPNKHGLHAPITGAGVGPDGTLEYNDICKNYGGYHRVWDDQQKNPYKFSGNQWFGYDDEQSIRIKTDFIKSQHFAGIMAWHLGADDVHGTCGPKQPLLRAVNQQLGRH